MTYIQRLVMQGFKSFNKKIAIPFSSTFSVICGPNGSGKSNVNDAICFVLGRTSAKSMRAERLHELIFHGGKSKEAAEIASVTLYLDNSKKEFPFDQDFITVTRKVNKNGASVYKLNDETVTRQQILDVLAAARIFPDGYNIVLQGDVTQIIEMDPIERRSVIDEIAGIKEYDEKKAKSEKEFEKVEQKLKEVGVVLKERDETYKKLEQERDAALKYQNMTNELKKLRASIANKRLAQSEQSFTSLTSEVDAKEKAGEEMGIKLTGLDAEIDKKEQELELLMKNLFERSKKIKIVRDVEELRAKILRINDKIEYDKRELSRLDMITSRLEGISADQESRAVSEILRLGKAGVFGTIASLLRVDPQYQVAIEVAAGPHINDLIVDNETTAIECVNFLKNNKIGRATFLPLNKIQERLTSLSHSDTSKAVGWANELVEYDRKYEIAFKFVFGSTLVVKDIETTRSIGIGKTRMVTLDGDLIERSGAIIGGFYRKRQKTVFDSKDIEEYKSTMGALRTEIETLAKQSKELSKELETKTDLERSEASDFVESEKKRNSLQRDSEALKRQRKTLFQERVNLQSELNKIKLQRARIEVERDNTKSEFSQYATEKEFYDLPVDEMESKVRVLVREIDSIGAVNMKAIDEFENFRDEFEQLRKRYDEVIKERDSIMSMISQIESRKKETFMKTFESIAANFKLIFKEMAHGDGEISLEEQDNIYSGLTLRASPNAKRLLSIDSMSGGEKTLTAMAFLFAIQNYKPAPFYIFDEIDAALDKANSKKIGEMMQRFSKNAQFILITHNDTTIRMANQIYGVSMDQGESKIISVSLPAEE
ncbi:MAG: chromosome segregation protein SMC [Candidatus Aenigmarchaeota archaeon]|nr:chromosome segregation protein SMC [Candidatus Aenigmarchaeota archaeon]